MNTGFEVKQRAGFYITFENGYTVSVQFDGGYYCDNYDLPSSEWGPKSSSNAECAVINPSGNLLELPGEGVDTVTNRSTPAEVLLLMNWAATL